MYKCEECEELFEEPASKRICFEEEYGVANLFETRTYTNILVCPYCRSTEIEEIRNEEIEEEENE